MQLMLKVGLVVQMLSIIYKEMTSISGIEKVNFRERWSTNLIVYIDFSNTEFFDLTAF